MTADQTTVLAILAAALVLFVWGRWRYDLVAVAALIAVVLAGLVPFEDAFLGFAHPAVITVAAVLVISRALQNGGVVDLASGLLVFGDKDRAAGLFRRPCRGLHAVYLGNAIYRSGQVTPVEISGRRSFLM
jgi:Na+/H+ antiporter NhaD/arsenite permease-like protein